MKTIKDIEKMILELNNDLEDTLANGHFVQAKDIYAQIKILRWVQQ